MSLQKQNPSIKQGNSKNFSSIDYRPDIDGLRALAVSTVVLFHAFPSLIDGGFIGVDIFFIISGYLISSIIFSNLNKGSFSYKEFYIRRIKRIFPAMITVIIVSLLVGWYMLFNHEFQQLCKHAAAGIGFIANLVLWSEASYFDRAAEYKVLLHFWSLGVEEQFYLIWPLVLVLCWRLNINVLIVTIVIIILSFILNITTVSSDPIAAFYSPLTRFWELAMGSLLAYLTLHKQGGISINKQTTRLFFLVRIHSVTVSALIANILAITGISLLIIGFLFISEESAFPGYVALLPTIGTCLLIMAGMGSWLNRKLLSARVVVYIGLISYPIYLWHWPLLVYLNYAESGEPSITLRLIMIATCLLLSALTYEFIEKPVRKNPLKTRRNVTLLLSLASILFIGSATAKLFDTPSRLDNELLRKLASAEEDWIFPPKEAKKTKYGDIEIFKLHSNIKKEVVYIGDSNMQQFAIRIADTIRHNPDRSYSATFITIGGCRPLFHVTKRKQDCSHLMPTAKRYIAENDIKQVVIAGRWHPGLFSENVYLLQANEKIPLSINSARIIALETLTRELSELSKQGVKIYLIQNIPSGLAKLEPVITLGHKRLSYPLPDDPTDIDMTVMLDEVIDHSGRRLLSELAQKSEITIIDPIPTFCSNKECPVLTTDGIPLYRDRAHVSASFIQANGHFLDETILISD